MTNALPPELEALRRAASAPATADELRGEDAAVQAYLSHHRPARRRLAAVPVLPSATLAAVGLGFVSAGALTAAAYTGHLPQPAQSAMRHLFPHLLPNPGAPQQSRHHRSTPLVAPTDTALPQHPSTPHGPRRGLPVSALQATVVLPRPVVDQGSSVTVEARLVSSSARPASLTLYASAPGRLSWHAVRRVQTSRAHATSVVLRHVSHSLLLIWRTSPEPAPDRTTYEGATLLGVRPPLSFTVDRTTAIGGNARVLITSNTTQSGRRVTIQRQLHGQWTDFAIAVLDAHGRGSVTVSAPQDQSQALRCVLPTSTSYAAAITRPRTLSPVTATPTPTPTP